MRAVTVYDRRQDGWRYVKTVEVGAESVPCCCKRCAKQQKVAIVPQNGADLGK